MILYSENELNFFRIAFLMAALVNLKQFELSSTRAAI
jgi:hypothetical protein